jgi:raffinose/stachyose/melibiose transport system substrate-binding protein
MIMVCLSCSPKSDRQIILRFAYPTSGDKFFQLMCSVIAEFEELHPGVTIKQHVMDSEIYQDFGLLTLFQSGQPPDLYGQWGGWLVGRDAKFGFAADLTTVLDTLKFQGRPWRERFLSPAWSGMLYESRNFGIPTSIGITNVLWFNQTIFQRFKLQPPHSWAALEAICQTLLAHGVTPISQGNRTVWPMGNWAAHVVSRVAGEQAYWDVMTLKPGTRFFNSDFVRALTLFEKMFRKNYFNPGMNGRSELEGMMLFLNGRSAMHPIGSWLVGQALDEGATLAYDAFNTPHIPGGKGDSTSIVGVTFGYLISRQTPHFEWAARFLEYLTRPEIQQRFVERGTLSSIKGAVAEDDAEPHLQKIMQMIHQARVVVPPPDTGFKLDISDAFYDAIALVVGGQMTAEEALKQADQVVRRWRE